MTTFEQIEHLVNSTETDSQPALAAHMMRLIMSISSEEKLAELVVSLLTEIELETFCDTINDMGGAGE